MSPQLRSLREKAGGRCPERPQAVRAEGGTKRKLEAGPPPLKAWLERDQLFIEQKTLQIK